MIGYFKKNRENYLGECFDKKKKKPRLKFNPGLVGPVYNWAKKVNLNKFLTYILIITMQGGCHGGYNRLIKLHFNWYTSLMETTFFYMYI